jgi:hypothetical protein
LTCAFTRPPVDGCRNVVTWPLGTDAKKIEAFRGISLSSRNRLASAFKRLTSADSSLVTPGRVPSSTSA